MDVNERKHINKLTDQMTAEALESKSILEYNGKDYDVKQDKVSEEHSNFLNYNKEAIHEAYLDIRKELGANTTSSASAEDQPEKKVTKKITHDDASLSQKKSEEKIEEKSEEKEKEEAESDSENESGSESDSEDDGNKKKEGKKKKGHKKKGKKGKKGKKPKAKTTTTQSQVN